MKGGVSLAVWIGGGVAELDLLRRVTIVGGRDAPVIYFARNTTTHESEEVLARAQIYGDLLISRGFDGITCDVLAGASAGGVNGVLYSVAQRAGASVDSVLDVWQQAGAIWELLRPDGWGSVPSLLQGDSYFWGRMRAAIDTLYGAQSGRNASHAAEEVVLDLSATISDADYRSSLPTRAGRGHFHFVGSNIQFVQRVGRGIPAATSDFGFDADVERLAYAARATSSFPGAFEPALIWSHGFSPKPDGVPTVLADADPAVITSDDVGSAGAAEPESPGADFFSTTVDMSMAFSAHRRGVNPFRVIDGGVLDNIPIDRAIHAIRAIPLSQAGTRILVYLDPSPDVDTLPAPPSPGVAPPDSRTRQVPRTDPLSRFWHVVRTGFTMRGVSESGPEEVNALGRLRRELLDDEGRLAALSRVVTPSAESREPNLQAYLLSRSTRDSSLITDLLLDPERWQLDSALEARRELNSFDRRITAGLADSFFEHYVVDANNPEAATRVAITTGSQSILDATNCCLGWLRDLENFASGHNAPVFLASEGDLRVDPPPAGGVREHLDHKELRDLLNTVSVLSRTHRDLDFARLLATLIDNPDSDVAAVWTSSQLDSSVKARYLWNHLAVAVLNLRRFSQQMAGFHDSTSPWGTFAAIPELGAQDAAPFVAVAGIPDPSSGLLFTAITASDGSDLDNDPAFAPLAVSSVKPTVQRWLRSTQKDFSSVGAEQTPRAKLDSNSKLAGASLANFAAFLSTTWRHNDWWWGRIDAAAGLATTLQSMPVVGPPPLTPTPMTWSPATVLQRLLIAEALHSSTPIALTEANHTVSDLRPGYLNGIVSRLVRVLLRAMVGTMSTASRVALYLLWPPVMVFAPLVLLKSRAWLFGSVAALYISLAASAPVRSMGEQWSLGWLWVGLGCGMGVLAAIRVVSGLQRIHAVGRLEQYRGIHGSVRVLLDSQLAAARRRGVVLVVIALVAGVGSVLAFTEGIALRSALCALVAVATGLAAWSEIQTLRPPSPVSASRAAWAVTSVAVWIAAFALAGLSTHNPSRVLPLVGASIPSQEIGIAICAAAFIFILAVGWLDGGLGDRPTALGVVRLLGYTVAAGVLALTIQEAITTLFGGEGNWWQVAGTSVAIWFLCSHAFWWVSSRWSGTGSSPNDTPLG